MRLSGYWILHNASKYGQLFCFIENTTAITGNGECNSSLLIYLPDFNLCIDF